MPNRKAAEKGTFEITDIMPVRGFRMESVASQLRIIEDTAFKRAGYEEAKAKREEMLQTMFKEGLITEDDLMRSADGRFEYPLANRPFIQLLYFFPRSTASCDDFSYANDYAYHIMCL